MVMRHDDPYQPLPRGLFKHGRQYRARFMHGAWVYFGTDYHAAVQAYTAWRRDGHQVTNTVGWLLDYFVGACAGRVKARKMAARTARDYSRDSAIVSKGLGHIPITALQPKHIVTFRDERQQSAPAHVRNEMAMLSAALSYAVEVGMLTSNPALQVKRPSRKRRERLIADDEYLTVYERAVPSVRLAMTLAVRTLALPDDVLAMGPRNVLRLQDGRRVLRFSRGKTGVWVEVEIVGELARLIDHAMQRLVVFPTFVHREDGQPYTVDGIGAMFRRYCVGTPKHPAEPRVTDFGLRDLRAKGATEMYRTGVPIRTIQRLLGHRSVQTTEIYLKSLVPEVVRPNEVPIIARVS